jgi:hypothetical protein
MKLYGRVEQTVKILSKTCYTDHHQEEKKEEGAMYKN